MNIAQHTIVNIPRTSRRGGGHRRGRVLIPLENVLLDRPLGDECHDMNLRMHQRRAIENERTFDFALWRVSRDLDKVTSQVRFHTCRVWPMRCTRPMACCS